MEWPARLQETGWVKIAFSALAVVVVAGFIYLRILHKRMQKLETTSATEEQARREVIEPPIATPSDVTVKAQIFWAGATAGTLQPVTRDLALSAEPAQRARQLLRELVDHPPAPEARTLPPDATVLACYVLANGTAIVDFGDGLASQTPSGITSEQLAVDSVARTLEANIPGLQRLKILIHGQEVDTLAGHEDLTGFFDLHSAAPAGAPATAPPAGGLTAPAPPGKLGR